jgi:branched-chain amino acid transport system substrate-binding protein
MRRLCALWPVTASGGRKQKPAPGAPVAGQTVTPRTAPAPRLKPAPPVRTLMPPHLDVMAAPLRVTADRIHAVAAPLRAMAAPIRATADPVPVTVGPIRGTADPIRVMAGLVPAIHDFRPPNRKGDRPIRGAAILLFLTLSAPAFAQPTTPGVTDTEITLGQTMAYSGPASAYGAFGKSETAYMRMINSKGGVHGRKINLISLDDGYLPPRSMEQTRRLVEQDNVFFMFAPLGTASNVVLRKYLNDHKVPQIFATSGIASFGDYKRYPWTIGWQPTYEIEGQVFVKYILKERPDAKIAILFQNDDLGRDYVRGIERELGPRAKTMILGVQSYEITDATVESQIVSLQGTGADTFIDVSTPKFAAQAIRKVYDIGWKPLHMLSYTSAAVAAVMKPAGMEKGIGIISSTYFKAPTDPRWAEDEDYRRWTSFMDDYLPGADKTDIFYVIGYMMANSVVQLLDQCGNDLTRENVMRQVANIDFRVPMLLPGMRITTSPTDFYPIKTLQLERFDGKSFVLFGDPITGVPNPK